MNNIIPKHIRYIAIAWWFELKAVCHRRLIVVLLPTMFYALIEMMIVDCVCTLLMNWSMWRTAIHRILWEIILCCYQYQYQLLSMRRETVTLSIWLLITKRCTLLLFVNTLYPCISILHCFISRTLFSLLRSISIFFFAIFHFEFKKEWQTVGGRKNGR